MDWMVFALVVFVSGLGVGAGGLLTMFILEYFER